MDYIQEPQSKIIRFGTEVIEYRKEFNFDKEERREEAIAMVLQWVQQQDHLIKKDYCKSYIEKCIITSNGSLERAKMQIDKMCTMRTMMPKYFEITNIMESDVMEIFKFGHIALVPQLTKDLYRIVILKTNPDAEVKTTDYALFYKLLVILAEFLKGNDYCRGFIMIADCYDSNAPSILSAINLIELQQLIPIITEGYGTKLKGLIFITPSKFIEGFVKLFKPLFSQKIASRIHVSQTKVGVKEYVNGTEVLPQEYGGNEEKTIDILSDDLFKCLSSKQHEELMKEMNQARTDESKRQRSQFNDQYMGMPGTFRSFSVD